MFTWVDHVFWAADAAGFGAVFALVIRSGAFRAWCSVAIYSGIQVVINLILAVMYVCHAWASYFYTQWPTEILLCFVKLAILSQIAVEAISNLTMVPKAFRLWFAVSVIAIAAAAWTFGAQGLREAHDLPALALLFNRATNMTVVAVISSFALSSSFFALKLKLRALRIDIGLSLIAVIDLLAFLAETVFSVDYSLSYRVQCSFHILSILVWARAFALPEAEPRSTTDEVRDMIGNVVRVARRERGNEVVY